MSARVIALTLTLMFAGASTAAAASITIGTAAGTNYTITGVADYSAISSQMNGMEITAYWTSSAGAHVQTRVWNAGATFAGSGFDLVISGDTFDANAWALDFDVAGNGRLQRLEFNGVPGNTVFDRTTQGTGTAGSDQGKDLAGFDGYCNVWFIVCFDPGDIDVTYFNQVSLVSGSFEGDLYAGVAIDFGSRGGLNEGDDWRFSLDTDIVTGLVPSNGVQAAAVPEPASMVLMGTGLLGLAAVVRRRRKS